MTCHLNLNDYYDIYECNIMVVMLVLPTSRYQEINDILKDISKQQTCLKVYLHSVILLQGWLTFNPALFINRHILASPPIPPFSLFYQNHRLIIVHPPGTLRMF